MVRHVSNSELQVYLADTSKPDLEAHWTCNDIDGTQGTEAINQNHLTLTDVTLESDTFDNLPTFGFNGTSSYGAIQNKNYNSAGAIDAMTVGGWVKSSDSQNQIIISFDRSEYFRLSLNDPSTGSNRPSFNTTDSSSTTDDLTGSQSYTDDSYHFIAGVYDSSPGSDNEKRLFIDGSVVASNDPHGGNSLGTGTTRYGMVGVGSEASSEDGTKSPVDYLSGELATLFLYEGRALGDSELNDMYNAGATAVAPDFFITKSDVKSLEIQRRIEQERDTGRIFIDNNDGTYNVGTSRRLQSGDRLRWRTQLDGESSLNFRWGGMVRQVVWDEPHYNKSEIILSVDDFVSGVISNRIVENSFNSTRIAGALDFSSILETVMNANASEIALDGVTKGSTTDTDIHFEGVNLMEAVNELASRFNAVAHGRDNGLVFREYENRLPNFIMDGSDKSGHIIREEDDKLANVIRVDGGRNFSLDEEQTTQSSLTTVTESSRITHQLTTRKSEIDRVELHTSKTGSGESVIVRIQKDDSGSPVAVGDTESDIVSEEVEAGELVDGGLTTFLFRDHNLHDPDPWMIIESSGGTGQDIGVDGSGNPTFKAYFPYRIVSVTEDIDSINSYRAREMKIQDRSLRTRPAARDAAVSALTHNDRPDVFVTVNAESNRMHNLSIGDKVESSLTNAGGEFIVTSITDEYDGVRLDTEIVMQGIESV